VPARFFFGVGAVSRACRSADISLISFVPAFIALPAQTWVEPLSC
jgi:hypothetical protein